MKTKTVTTRYEIVDDNTLEEIALNAINAKDSDNFLGYASSISQFHHYVASMVSELQQFRSGTRDPQLNTVTRVIEE